jgi:GDP-mannose 4,6-dehydratase
MNKDNKINKVLITGITGFVGSHLADYILENFPEVKILGLARWRSPTDNIRHILNKIMLQFGDLLDPFSLKTILSEHKPDVIFHLAAQSYVTFSFSSPVVTLDTNIIGTCNLLETVKELKFTSDYNPIIHICSSSEVYGQVNKEDIPIKEDVPLRPASPYAVSKVAEDMLGYQYWLSWRIKTLRTRMFTHTGPRRGDVFVVSNFAKQIVYNIGGVETMKVGEMLNRLLGISSVKNIKIEIDPNRLRPSDVTLQIPCTNKFFKETGWKPEIKFGQTIKDTLNYWREYYRKERG